MRVQVKNGLLHKLGLLCNLPTFKLPGAGSQFESGRGAGAPVRSESGGTDPAQLSAGKNFFGRAPPLFGSKSTINFLVIFVSAFVLASFLLFAVLLY